MSEWISVKDQLPFKDTEKPSVPVALRILKPGFEAKGFFSGKQAEEKIAFGFYGYKIEEFPEEIFTDRAIFKLKWGFMDPYLNFINDVTHYMPLPKNKGWNNE